MGGGGAMRTAAKLAGIAGGIKGATVAPPAKHSVRNVFGGVPSFQEAKAATADLKDAIDTIYLKSDSSECKCTSFVSQGSVLSPFNTELETKAHAIQASSNPSVPKDAFQAFQLLSASHEAQIAVASITSDPNVWNAVMQSPAVKDFLESQQQTVAGFEKEGAHEKGEELPNSDLRNRFAYFMGMLYNLKLRVAEMVSNNNLKVKVAEMVSKVSNYFQNIFEFSEAEKLFADADGIGNTKANLKDHFAVGRTFMGLVVLVVMVVVLKRVPT